MKKIPTLFKREIENHRIIGIESEVTPGMEWVLRGEGFATVKYDGACCAFIDGVFYKRFDAKHGRVIPAEAIPCCEPDPVTGHHPHWVKVDKNNPADKWFLDALGAQEVYPDGTYEAIGRSFNGNPYCLPCNRIVRHGQDVVDVERTFDGIRTYLLYRPIEGIVFWKDGEPMCKIKKTDFGFKWKGLKL